jgi:predicted kinase
VPGGLQGRDQGGHGVTAGPGFEPAPGDPLTVQTVDVFFDVIRRLVEAEVSLVAEAAFQDRLWRHGLEPLLERVRLRIVQCAVDPVVAWERARQRIGARPAHAVGAHVHDLAAWTEVFTSFERLSLDAPSLAVDTTDGYAPSLAGIVGFVGG